MRRRRGFFSFRNIKRAVIILVLVVIAGYAGITIATQCTIGGQGSEPPKIGEAPYRLQTPNRVYYIKQYEDIGEDILLYQYWEREGKKWVFYDRGESPLPMNKKSYYGLEIEVR